MIWWLALPRWLRAVIIAAALAIPLIIAASLYVSHREDAAVAAHERDITADVAERVSNGFAAADAEMLNRQAADEIAAQATEDAIHDAEERHPQDAKAAAGPVSRAAIDSLRQRTR